MLDRVPVPTDNVYKFYALFSLVALIFCVWLFFSKHAEKNAIASKNFPEIAEIKSIEKPTAAQTARLAIMEKQLEVAESDNKLINKFLFYFGGFFLTLMAYGFNQWQTKIQPVVDASQKAQLEILQLQIEQLKLENQKLAASLASEKESQALIVQPVSSFWSLLMTLLRK